uniref:Rab-GAP TBC domain-containing protein n=1 Tax=Gongylonema pulchrum TaxID=637853 RepID=A0A183DHQ7_9BILA
LTISNTDCRKSDLFELLKAYTVLHPEEGYCQAQAPVAAVLLMHMPLRDAFYCFVQICHKYLPGYYSAGLVSILLLIMQQSSSRKKCSNCKWKAKNLEKFSPT